MTRVSPYLLVILIFFGFWVLVSLVNNSSEVSEEYGSPRSCLSTRSLDTVEDVMDGEVDELEEDLG